MPTVAELRQLWPFGDRHEDSRLSALLDDELDDDAALEVVRHVSACARCLEELDAIRQARAAVRGLPPVSLPGRIDIDARPPQPRLAPHTASLGRRLLAALIASTTVIGGAAFLAGGQGGTVTPPVDVYVVDHVGGLDAGPLLHPVDLGR